MTAGPLCVCGHSRELHPRVRQYIACCKCDCAEYRAAADEEGLLTVLANESPSGDALDRATKLVMETGHNKLVSEVAKLLDRADATAGSAAVLSLSNVPTDQLLAELARRLAERPPAAPHDVLDMS